MFLGCTNRTGLFPINNRRSAEYILKTERKSWSRLFFGTGSEAFCRTYWPLPSQEGDKNGKLRGAERGSLTLLLFSGRTMSLCPRSSGLLVSVDKAGSCCLLLFTYPIVLQLCLPSSFSPLLFATLSFFYVAVWLTFYLTEAWFGGAPSR